MIEKNAQPVLLLYPPPSDPTQPYSSLPVLTGILRHNGFNVIQKDLGILFIDNILTPEKLTQSLNSVMIEKEELHKKANEKFFLKFQEIVGFSNFIIEHVNEAKNVMRDPLQFYDIPRYQWATSVLNLACELISLANYPEILTPCDYQLPIKYTYQNLRNATSKNLFYEIFKNEIVPNLISLNPLLVGISISYFSQIVPAFTLSRLVKKLAPNLHITIGGPMISMINQQIIQDKAFFEFVDSFVKGEGETALLELTKNILENKGFESVPNLILKNSLESDKKNMWFQEDFRNLPHPDFEGLELNQYFSPEPVFLISTSRGCYHGKCAFCNVSMNTRKNFRTMSGRNLSSLIRNLHSKYKVRRFFFCDDALPLRNMLEVSHLIRNDLPMITWAGEARFETTLTEENLFLLKRGGCRELIFGLESASQRVLNLMNKNNTVECDLRILRSCKELGIAVNVQTFIGFPMETREEALKTIEFLIENEDLVNSTGFTYFCLYKDTPIFKDPKKFGIKIVSEAFGLRYNFKRLSGMTSEEINKIFTSANKKLNKIYGYKAKYLSKVSGAHTLLHLSHYSLDELTTILRNQKKSLQNKMDFPNLIPIFSPNLLFSPPDISNGYERTRILHTITGNEIIISKNEYQLLTLCNGKSTISEIANTWSDKNTNTHENFILCYTKALVLIKKCIVNDILLV